MRNIKDTASRIVAGTPELELREVSVSWLPTSSYPQVALDPARWSQRARQARYWRMVEILNRARRTH